MVGSLGAAGLGLSIDMDIDGIQKRLEDTFGAAVGPVTQGRVENWIEVDADKIDGVSEYLQSHPDLKFEVLTNLTGCDYPDKGHIQIIYSLVSYDSGAELTIKVNADREDPKVNTVMHIWAAADWLEREVFDLLGVDFIGHSDQRRILLPDDWIGNPLRKDYVEAPDYHGISTVRESLLSLDIPGRR
jgi:NADH-quinone oxidoreductase subunit C